MVAEVPTEEFFDRVTELQELHDFVLTSPQTVFLLIGKMGMGKSKLVKQFHRQLRNNSNFLVPDISVLYGAQSPEEFASDLNHKLTDGRFMLWRPEDPTTIRRLLASFHLWDRLYKR
jgi:energy-coupling factor transporter ATP-binding protein EcfA2